MVATITLRGGLQGPLPVLFAVGPATPEQLRPLPQLLFPWLFLQSRQLKPSGLWPTVPAELSAGGLEEAAAAGEAAVAASRTEAVPGLLPCHLLSQCQLLHLIITPSINKLLHTPHTKSTFISGSQHSDTWKTDEMGGFSRNGTPSHIVWYSNYTMYMSKQFIYYIYNIKVNSLM